MKQRELLSTCLRACSPVSRQLAQAISWPYCIRPYSSGVVFKGANGAIASGAVAATSNSQLPVSRGQQEAVQLLRRYNIASPELKGSVVLAKVIRSGHHTVLVDPGYFSLVEVHRSDLVSAQPFTADGAPIARAPSIARLGSKTSRFKAGDYVKLRLSSLFTPFGDVQLDPVTVPPQVREKLVWQELEARMKRATIVRGRILNRASTKTDQGLVHGWAVAVAGYVGFLQDGSASPEVLKRIGTLQDFYIHSMDKRRKRIILDASNRPSSQSLYESTLTP